MSEMTKTMFFIGAALAAMAAGLLSQRSTADFDIQDRVGEILAEFDPSGAKRLKIVKFDEETATLSDFEVAQDSTGLWTLPSKNGYPADAERQIGQAAGNLLDLDILTVVSDSAADHQEYSLVDPDSSKLEAGQEGVGMRVGMYDASDEALIDLIIGKPVKDMTDQYFVREAGRPAIYTTKINPDQLSTKFSDWIEDDLLKLNAWDIRQVQVNDYSAELVLVGFQPQIQWDRRGEYNLLYNDADSKWEATSLKVYNEDVKEFQDTPLTDGEELDSSKLNDLKSALDDLKIVDVEKKPSGLSANLKTGKDFLQDNQAISSLVQRGFAPVPLESEDLDILSSEGEIICTMKNGTEYVLRFGNLQVANNNDQTSADETDGEDKGDGVSRYLFVMARFNEEAIEKPELEVLPELPNNAVRPAEEMPEEESDSGTDEVEEEGTESEERAEATDNSSEDGNLDSTEMPEESENSEAENEEVDLESIIAERKRIEAANQSKLDEYKEKIEEGKKTVEELNVRFGDWYYVISNDIFEKIRLGRDDLVKLSENTESKESETTESPFGAPGTAVPGVPGIPGE